ncbi:MAG: hypothetical protein WC830_12280 [Burkholderiales bacterium]
MIKRKLLLHIRGGMMRASRRLQGCDVAEKQTWFVLVFNHNRVFCTDTLFIRTKNAVGARSAQ